MTVPLMLSSDKCRPGDSHDIMSLPEHVQSKLQHQKLQNRSQ